MTRLHWKWALRRFRVWGVRDYYTQLEKIGGEGAEITSGYFLMIFAATLLATAGLLMDSPTVIIGAMCVAPFLAPSRSVCIGVVFRNRKLFFGGLFKQVIGLLLVGATIAYLITVMLNEFVPGINITREILLRSMPTMRDFILSIIIAIGAGMAASLALTADPRILAQPWGQIIDAMIGVEIAISLLPPAAVIGIGFALGQLDISTNAFWLLVVNILGLDILGSTLMLVLRGIHRRYLELEKNIRKTIIDTLKRNLTEIIEVEAHIVLLSDSTADVHATVYYTSPDISLPATLAQCVASEIADKTYYRSNVFLEFTLGQTHFMVR